MTEPFSRTHDGRPICPFCERESDTDEFETHMCWGHDHPRIVSHDPGPFTEEEDS